MLGGRISSRSTGTPSETRNKRLIRDRVQLGGCIGGGETSCCQRERERSDKKGEVVDISNGGTSAGGGGLSGNMASRYGFMASWISEVDLWEKFRGGCCEGQLTWLSSGV